jgi:hypothetical protein
MRKDVQTLLPPLSKFNIKCNDDIPDNADQQAFKPIRITNMKLLQMPQVREASQQILQRKIKNIAEVVNRQSTAPIGPEAMKRTGEQNFNNYVQEQQ